MIRRFRWRGITVTALVIVITAGFYSVLNNEIGIEPPAPPPVLWVYAINEADIEEVTVQQAAFQEHYIKTGLDWFLARGRESLLVDPDRWGAGVPLLLSGPSANRVFDVLEDGLVEFGFTSPTGEIEMSLRGERRLHVLVGDTTPNGKQHYVRLAGRPEVSLVPASWVTLLLALATDPAVLVTSGD
jgi:hypothetical protein